MSEIILQQTRVEQGRAYYERFIANYPDVSALAVAGEETVFKLWEGLGYYSRCRNMISAAKEIQGKYDGKFPEKIEEIRALPGVGAYTAAAISSFAFDQPHAVLDGNVFRLLSRFFAIDEPIDSTSGRKLFEKLSGELLDKKNPAQYNQAIMDFGATVCKPRQPLCAACLLRQKCSAFAQNKVSVLPVKSKKLVRKMRWFNFLILVQNGKILIEKRGPKDIWENLYQFPMLESQKIPASADWNNLLNMNISEAKEPDFHFQTSQQLTHQTIHGRFFIIRAGEMGNSERFQPVNISEIRSFPFPRIITGILAELPNWLS